MLKCVNVVIIQCPNHNPDNTVPANSAPQGLQSVSEVMRANSKLCVPARVSTLVVKLATEMPSLSLGATTLGATTDLRLVHLWSTKTPVGKAHEEVQVTKTCEVGYATAVDWYNFVTDKCIQYFIDHPAVI
ncbi:hypothetical protein EMCRGX_G005564 [Ephydatia muelleri]